MYNLCEQVKLSEMIYKLQHQEKKDIQTVWYERKLTVCGKAESKRVTFILIEYEDFFLKVYIVAKPYTYTSRIQQNIT